MFAPLSVVIADIIVGDRFQSLKIAYSMGITKLHCLQYITVKLILSGTIRKSQTCVGMVGMGGPNTKNKGLHQTFVVSSFFHDQTFLTNNL